MASATAGAASGHTTQLMYHELFDLWKELRDIDRELARLKDRKMYLRRKWVLTAKFISGKAVVPKPWERSYAKPENVVDLKVENGKQDEQQRHRKRDNGVCDRDACNGDRVAG